MPENFYYIDKIRYPECDIIYGKVTNDKINDLMNHLSRFENVFINKTREPHKKHIINKEGVIYFDYYIRIWPCPGNKENSAKKTSDNVIHALKMFGINEYDKLGYLEDGLYYDHRITSYRRLFIERLQV